MAVTKRGTALNWGVDFACTAFGTFAGQNVDINKGADMTEVLNGQGEADAVVFRNFSDEGSFTYWPQHATTVTVPAVGDLCTVTGTGSGFASGSNWICINVKVAGSNTSFVQPTVTLKKWPSITS